ncbi:uncharacterized protein RCC_12327 [Ramularia collo-cygni]|uniref:DUF4470 domain-containing protein n=1 Tax=Ramularia collo-cygni TaxID=112498 RepID=A0A2D3UWK3_9PEZI|nr:uncharacterized protein RCC_12327 [Ramularia collo-cygni]CZT15456.1 uncharacterized protein RCC_12327 [Ramularia collo-cygni]
MAEATTASQQLRAKGNEAYLAGRVPDAISLYEKAAEAAPDDPAPLSNLSAAFFELGDYNASVKASDHAMAFSEDESKRQKLYLRKAKSLLYLLDYDAAAVTVENLEEGVEKTKLNAVILNTLQSRSKAEAEESLTIPRRLITDLPRYKEMIRNVQQYFTVGHDIPESLYDGDLLDTGREKISLLFAGIGDGRHLYHTILSAGFDKKASEKCFHLTIVDHKAGVIARDFLVLLMINDFSKVLDDDEKKATSLIFPLFYYTYLSPIMPPLLHDVLQAKIGDAIAILHQPELMPAFLDIPIAYHDEALRMLMEWQEEAGTEYPTKPVREEVVRQRKQGKQSQLGMLMKYGKGIEDIRPPPVSCEKEQAFYEEFGILTMNWASHQLFYEEELQQAFDDFDMDDPEALNADFLDKVDDCWKTNPTFVDLEWQRNREDSHMYLVVNHDPFETGHDLLQAGAKAPEKQGLLNIVSFWFNGICHGFSRMRGRCKVEACIGDIATVLEQITSGTVGHRAASDGSDTVTDKLQADDILHKELVVYPAAYDRIHLSNIPDYIGGSLPVYLHAIPALYPGETSYVTSTCLRNPPRWNSHRDFDHEYVALSEPTELESIFHVRVEQAQDLGDYPILAQYVRWYHHPVPASFSNLLPRARLETWLYRLFFKTMIPIARPMRDSALIYSPLNLTVFLRLCSHLHTAGYPAHWMSGVLEALISGSVRTTARPPRSDPLAIEETERKMPMLMQSTKPFIAELTSLLSFWQFSLPFGVLSDNIPNRKDVHRYEIDFPKCEDFYAETPVFILALFHLKILPVEACENVRPVLLSDELGSSSPRAREARDVGLHIISTWKWKRAAKRATFWLREDVLNAYKDDPNWGLAIWRTDTWILHSGPRGLRGLRDMGRFWMD